MVSSCSSHLFSRRFRYTIGRCRRSPESRTRRIALTLGSCHVNEQRRIYRGRSGRIHIAHFSMHGDGSLPRALSLARSLSEPVGARILQSTKESSAPSAVMCWSHPIRPRGSSSWQKWRLRQWVGREGVHPSIDLAPFLQSRTSRSRDGLSRHISGCSRRHRHVVPQRDATRDIPLGLPSQ